MLLTGVEKLFDRSEKDLSLQSKSFFTGVKSKKDGDDYPDSCYISYAKITLVLYRTHAFTDNGGWPKPIKGE
jgi:hypothetical protein